MENTKKEENFESKKKTAWERMNSTQIWAGKAKMPLMMRLVRTSKLVGQRMEDSMNLSLPHMRILWEATQPGGVSQSDLHKQYKVDPASITRTVQTLERDGLITRAPDPADNRLMRVFITDKGRALVETLPARIAEFERQLVEGLEDTEILQLHSLLDRLEARLIGEGANFANKPEKK